MMGRIRLDRPVLVVDDVNSTRYATVRGLTAGGAEVVEAVTGAQALELAPGCGAVVLDINLPDTDGYAVCRALRADPATRNVPIIHLSARHLRDADKIQGLESGADAYLTHPVDPGVLVATLNAMLRTRAAEQSAARSLARLHAVVENAPIGIGLVRVDGFLLEFNERFTHMFGPAGAPGRAALPEAVREAMRDSRVRDVPITGTHTHAPAAGPDGERRIEWHVSRIDDELALVLATDITERYQFERERADLLERERRARNDAEQANHAKDTFLALLSHELRNPLNNIAMWATILRRPEAAPRLQEGLAAIERGVALQGKLVADLLDMARLSTGKLELDLEPVRLGPVVRDVALSLDADLQAKGLALALDIDEGAEALADPARLHQVLWNLLTNAIKFSNPGGVVVVAVTGGDPVVLRVRDEGVGIEPGLVPKLFERFRQGAAGRQHGFGGLGLGLSIVRNLIELHGGTIAAHSEGRGHGATFEVRLPAYAGDASQSVPPSRALAGKQVLVVEDERDMRALLALALEQEGAAVHQADSAESAMRLLESRPLDLLISDIGLPGGDGMSLLRNLRAGRAGNAAVPAIAITAFASDKDIADARDAGFRVHFAKPIDIAKVIRAAAGLVASEGEGARPLPQD